jgi:hypothetical protein
MSLTPTELPRKKSVMQRVENEFENDAKIPKRAVKKRVALKAVLRPMKSEPTVQNELDNLDMKEGKLTYMYPSPLHQSSSQQTLKMKQHQYSYQELERGR